MIIIGVNRINWLGGIRLNKSINAKRMNSLVLNRLNFNMIFYIKNLGLKTPFFLFGFFKSA